MGLCLLVGLTGVSGVHPKGGADSLGWADAFGIIPATTTEATRTPAAVDKTVYLLTIPPGIKPVIGMGESLIAKAWVFQ